MQRRYGFSAEGRGSARGIAERRMGRKGQKRQMGRMGLIGLMGLMTDSEKPIQIGYLHFADAMAGGRLSEI